MAITNETNITTTTDLGIVLRLSDFSKRSACINAERHIIDTETRGNRHLDEAVIVKDVCRKYLAGELEYGTLEDLVDDVAVSYENPDEQEETQDSFVQKLSERIFRYIHSEYRQNFIIPERSIRLDLTGYAPTPFAGCDAIDVRIDAIVREPGILEGIIYKKGAPKLGATTRSYYNVENELPLHLVRLALRKYADVFLEEGEQVVINASYYYMKKTSDKSDTNCSHEDYFGDKAPIRTQTESYTKMPAGHTFPDGDLDKIAKELLDKYAVGYEKHELCEDKDCVNCKFYCSCYYKPAPEPVAKVEGNKKREKHVLTDEQEAIVNARDGVFVCDAVPGSGKTETAIKQRTVSIILDELNDVIARYEAGEDVVVEAAAPHTTNDSRW